MKVAINYGATLYQDCATSHISLSAPVTLTYAEEYRVQMRLGLGNRRANAGLSE
ncbi:hypothetical protein LCGC14_2494390, partial [marine sediment metagenome]